MNRITRRLRGDGPENGFALAMVLGIGIVVTLLVATMVATSVSGTQKAQSDANASAALAAAYAGIEDYQSKLANDNAYYQYGNSASTFSNPVATAANPTPTTSRFTGTNNNPAFNLGAGGVWAPVDGSNGRAKYRYEVDNSQYFTTGVLRLRSTGMVGTTVRSEVADLKQNGFINYLYFTDYEILDPNISSLNCSTTSGTLPYAWSTGGHLSACSEIQFGPNDDIQGPVHSNDTLQVCGSQFEDSVETGWNDPAKKYYVQPSGCAAGRFSTKPVYAPPIAMPATNTAMKQETRSDLTSSTVPRPGCLYTGPTSIVFNNDGTMTVHSPWTVDTNVTEDANLNDNGGSVNAACGTPGPGTLTKTGAPQASGTLGSVAGQTFAVPSNNLIYVQAVPRSNTYNDPNYWKTGAYPTGLTCTGASGTGTGNGIGYPVVNEKAPSSVSGIAAYGCDSGDVFVQGTLQGQVTVAAANYVYITGDLLYSTINAATNLLGLVGQNAVWVSNPVNSAGTLLDTKADDRTINAAILSVGHTFLVQNWASGAKGDLIIYGSIAQKYRGPVGLTNGSGYTKDYEYDKRLKFTAPPKFLQPVTTSYGISTLTEVKPGFTAAGAQVAG